MTKQNAVVQEAVTLDVPPASAMPNSSPRGPDLVHAAGGLLYAGVRHRDVVVVPGDNLTKVAAAAAIQRDATREVPNERQVAAPIGAEPPQVAIDVGADGRARGADSEKAIDYALKLNELALSLSTASIISMSIFLMNHRAGAQPKWVFTALLFFFSSIACSLAGVQFHPLLKHSCMYVGTAGLCTFFSGIAVTAVSVLPEQHRLVASTVALVYAALIAFLMLRGVPWLRRFGGGVAALATRASPTATARAGLTKAPPFSRWLSGHRGHRSASGVSEESAAAV